MKRLGLDVLDFFPAHQPYGDLYGSWRAMQELHREGQIRGCDHPHAVRILARAWLRVLWRAWNDRSAYDPERHGGARRIAA